MIKVTATIRKDIELQEILKAVKNALASENWERKTCISGGKQNKT